MIIEATITIRLTETEYHTVKAVLPRSFDEWRTEIPAEPATVGGIIEALHRSLEATGFRPTEEVLAADGGGQ
jgi:hypothetical protein